MKKVMNFLFGKKPPIFDSKGDIDHKRAMSFKKWRDRYINDGSYNWKNHSGMLYKKQPKK